MKDSSIEWTQSTWNCLRGCSVPSITLPDGTKIPSPGCLNCYAKGVAYRFSGDGLPYEGLARKDANGHIQWTGKVMQVPEHLEDPIRWRKPRRIFVTSVSDPFHPSVPDEFVVKMWAVMAVANHHTFQLLTKRPERMRRFLSQGDLQGRIVEAAQTLTNKPSIVDVRASLPLSNVWLGTSVENQDAARQRIPELLATPAAVRFLSCEPLLGPLELDAYLPSPNQSGVDWVIVGGESGPGSRPMDLAWARQIRDQCVGRAALFMKQVGTELASASSKGTEESDIPVDLRIKAYPRPVPT